MKNQGRTIIIRDVLCRRCVAIGLVVRLVLACLLPRLLDGTGVPYTDIDYYVFTDAAEHVNDGGSPYDRHTYRYTPFLAGLLSGCFGKHCAWASRYVFCVADAVCGALVLRHNKQQNKATTTTTLTDALWWLYNPLAINICTRGSSESLQILLPVLLTLRIATTASSSRGASLPVLASLAGILHGIAIHAKLYPIVYTLAYMAFFANREANRGSNNTTTQQQRGRLLIYRFVLPLLRSVSPWVFLVASLGTFALTTYAGVVVYGPEALHEGLLYHFSRVDHRHNYSMHWYPIYLATAANANNSGVDGGSMALLGKALLLPQIALLFYTSFIPMIQPQQPQQQDQPPKVQGTDNSSSNSISTTTTNNNIKHDAGNVDHRDNNNNLLPLTLFLQTYIFVTFNKVITAQYFTWYLCLLPLCAGTFRLRAKNLRLAAVFLLVSILSWLGHAYFLEMRGRAVHRSLWAASVVCFFANVAMICVLLQNVDFRNNNTESSSSKSKSDTIVSKKKNNNNNPPTKHKVL